MTSDPNSAEVIAQLMSDEYQGQVWQDVVAAEEGGGWSHQSAVMGNNSATRGEHSELAHSEYPLPI